jgi:hypothetical protein
MTSHAWDRCYDFKKFSPKNWRFSTPNNYKIAYAKNEPGGNPTIMSYNASAVNIYNAASSLVRFENKKNILP